MNHSTSAALQQFKNLVGIKFQLYNSLFTSLPFHRIEKTGILLSLLHNNCEEGFKKHMSPVEIVEEFFEKQTAYVTEQEQLDLLFRIVQYVERQVVLFDALEDTAFRTLHNMSGPGTLSQLDAEVQHPQERETLEEKLRDFSLRIVLTAHPTQFYPGSVLGIINDLSRALAENNATQVNMYLQQLGKTPFFKKLKPTPYDEAISLIWYLENVFYTAVGRIVSMLKTQFPDAIDDAHPVFRMGFWPGGDRDGNPFVTVDTTLQVADALRSAIIKCYYLEVRRIKRRLTFEGVDSLLADLEKNLYNNIFIPGQRTDITKSDILATLHQIKDIITYQHNGLFVHLVDGLIAKVETFGLHFATLDVRQDSSVHTSIWEAIAEKTMALPDNYATLPDEEKIDLLVNLKAKVDPLMLDDSVHRDTLQTIPVIRKIQQYNGEEGCNRYIISQCTSALNAMEVYGLFVLDGWKPEEIKVDIVPLFETVDDLRQAAGAMEQLYKNPIYREHLERRGNVQSIMLGFSDGTKDGGYLMANWRIYKAKEELTQISLQYNINVVFFDGRGGPPARGGGKTHKFYASLGPNIANKEIQLTIQGQTVSSNFGTVDAARFNIEQLIHAGIYNNLQASRKNALTAEQEALLETLSDVSYKAYIGLKEHPVFVDYLRNTSPLRFYAETNIGSRPAKRGGGNARFTLKDLRAIPFVGAWSQLKQNVTGYYGVGTALKHMEEAGQWEEVKKLYQNSLFFRALIDNCEMAMKKCFFPLTSYLAKHPVYGEIWNKIYEEYTLTEKYLFLLSGKNELMAGYPIEQQSIQMRERIVLPLTTIQQFALTKIREMEEQLVKSPLKSTYEKLVMRCSFGIINAGRNSA